MTSTPPIGGIIFFVEFKIGLDGNETINQSPLLMFTLGYHVKINLIRKIKVKNDKSKPNPRSTIGKNLTSNEITIV